MRKFLTAHQSAYLSILPKKYFVDYDESEKKVRLTRNQARLDKFKIDDNVKRKYIKI